MVNLLYPHHEISRIITAAVVSPHFCHALLANPEGAIAAGFGDETFVLEQEVFDQLSRIHASSLKEFAAKIILL